MLETDVEEYPLTRQESEEKLVVIVRTLNEEHRIADFCGAYSFADYILVSDGGSADYTESIAETFPNVLLRPYHQKTELANGYWRNNDSDHANFLIQWANELKPDWIIYDDCDMRPNFLLKQYARGILKETYCDVVMTVKLYLWGLDQHFPYMAKPGKGHDNYEPSLWAWRGGLDLWTVDKPPAYDFRIGENTVNDFAKEYNTLSLFPPYCCLHFSWDDPERVEEKMKTYRDSGFISGQLHPLDFAGILEPLPEWGHE